MIANVITLKAQNQPNSVILCSFGELHSYESGYYDLNTGKEVPLTIAGLLPNASIKISADISNQNLWVSYWRKRDIQQINKVTRIRQFKYPFNTIFFICSLDDNTELSIQCQLNEGIAFIYYQNLPVVSLDYECNWSTLKKLCNQWY